MSFVIDVLELSGSPTAWGRAMGAALGQDRKRAEGFRRHVLEEAREVKGLPEFEERLFRAFRALVEREAPWVGDWLRGLAGALPLPEEELWLYNFGSYFRDLARIRGAGAAPEGGCSTFAVSSTRDGPLLAKNRDCPASMGPWQVWVRVRPEAGLGWLALSSYGVAGASSSGMNEAGLAVADTHVYSRDVGRGLPRFVLMAEILMRCRTVGEALAFLSRVPIMGRGNLLLADGEGTLGLAELGHSRLALRRLGAGFLVNTNHFTDPALAEAFVDVNPPSLRGTSQARHARLTTLLSGRGCQGLEDAKRILSYHGDSLDSLCRHEEIDPPYRTICGVIYLPQARAVLYTGGYPCEGHYQRLGS
ncbi:MAG: Peptidase C45 acyl-coenzyme A:6-aminopenicillanic acid acyl-transferase [Acetothermia bacterium 64_32]|nr:MAG: Peptidase C45 acyl-coenzyme A:6-aminopenicillanic acid acyl-transferase [Acetothermia bacterium 64_32]HAF71090.1 hypothetical protein [Candidatus Acetothermia bacterium]